METGVKMKPTKNPLNDSDVDGNTIAWMEDYESPSSEREVEDDDRD